MFYHVSVIILYFPVELDNTGVIDPDTDAPQEMGDDSLLVNDDMLATASAKRAEAMEAASEGKFEEAVQLYTEAIKNNPCSALMYAKRARYDCAAY